MIYHKNKIQQDVGATAIEYGLIASLVAVVAVGGMSAVGMNLSNTYCTVSKHLGGSGTCSGATSGSANGGGSTSGNGSLGSSTASVNSTNSYAEDATMDDVNNSLKEKLNNTYVPTLYGGNDYEGGQSFHDWEGDAVPTFAEYMKNINATDPITNVFGAYNPNDGSPVTDYSTVLNDFKNGGSTIHTGSTSDGHSIEVTTASGKVYTLHANGSAVTQTEGDPKNP